jgi:hypothetical protein
LQQRDVGTHLEEMSPTLTLVRHVRRQDSHQNISVRPLNCRTKLGHAIRFAGPVPERIQIANNCIFKSSGLADYKASDLIAPLLNPSKYFQRFTYAKKFADFLIA